jgi:2-oxoglutarate dehydrogenase E1 component
VIVDNVIASSESKWRQPCDLVLLLPHGFVGQGPEHSSARLERYLTLCAEDNMRVANPTTAAQYFHLLRRQMRDAKRIPLVVMTPKSLLRHPGVASRLGDLSDGGFSPVLDDSGVADRSAVQRVLLTAGKVYYDLAAERERRGSKTVAIVRLEEYYPYPEWHVANTLGAYPNAKEICWVQEEPENMGAWNFLRQRILQSLPFARPLRYIGRTGSSSPASGSGKAHRAEQAALLTASFE